MSVIVFYPRSWRRQHSTGADGARVQGYKVNGVGCDISHVTTELDLVNNNNNSLFPSPSDHDLPAAMCL